MTPDEETSEFMERISYLTNAQKSKGMGKHFEASQEYDDKVIGLIELIYGEGMLSPGGIQSLEEMFVGTDLNGIKALDLGCGLGMYDIYLAKKKNVEIVGVDPQQRVIEKANANLKKHQKELKGRVSFLLLKDPGNLKQFRDKSFDLVFSKESLLHVPYEVKEGYYKEIHRVLKPGGKIVISDWMHSSPNYSANTLKMMELDGLVYQMVTPKEYQELLKIAGFKNIQLEDTTAKYAQISADLLKIIQSKEKEITKKYGDSVYKYSLESWTYQYEGFKNRELLLGTFRADK